MKMKVAGTPKRATVALAMFAMFTVRAAAVQPHVMFKAPRVYNALITSDQQLLPSRADPIVEPVFRSFQYIYGWPGAYAVVPPAWPSSGRDVAAGARAENPARTEATDATRTEDDDGWPTAVVKNNKPADVSVPDVPPPPLPVSRGGQKDGKKKPEEFPPAPVGFAI